MPTFLPPEAFDLERMSDDDRRRFHEASAAYDAVQHANRQAGSSALWPHTPGPKSALFHRLLSGKPALPHPPPTSFSYPWYDVIEASGPFSVLLGHDLFVPDPHAPTTLLINQCRWERVGHCAAAQALTGFLGDTNARRLPDDRWHHEVDTLLAANPQWTVRFDPWPPFVLKMGRQRVNARRDALLRRRDSVEGGNPLVLEVLHTWADEQRDNDERRRAAAARPEAERSTVEHLLLSAHRFEGPVRASDWDWVAAEVDGWQIQRADAHPLEADRS